MEKIVALEKLNIGEERYGGRTLALCSSAAHTRYFLVVF